MYYFSFVVKLYIIIDIQKAIIAKFNFVLVKGQSLDVDPDPVKGVFGEFVEITWTFTKVAQSDEVMNTRLFLGADPGGELLYSGVPLIKLEDAKRRFGDRIKATWKEPQYTLTLSNLSFSDTITFSLAINSRINGSIQERSVAFKSVQIIEVKGMYFL